MMRLDKAALARIVADIHDRFPISGIATAAGVKLRRAGREWVGLCPLHAEKTPSFTIYADDRRAICFGCGWQGDVLDLVQAAYGVKLPAAIEMLTGGELRVLEQQLAPAKPKSDLRPLVNRIIRNSTRIDGTAAEKYLRRRGINLPLPAALRFARLAPPQVQGNGVLAANGPDPLPTMVAVVSDAAGDVVGLQRTYLTEDGCKAATTDPKGKVKFSLGDVRRAAVRLGPVVSNGLALTEGIEDALSLIQFGAPSAWAAAGTSMLPFVALPDEVRAVVIGGDANPPGRAAAEKAAQVIVNSGREVQIIYPAAPHVDFNDELCASGGEMAA